MKYSRIDSLEKLAQLIVHERPVQKGGSSRLDMHAYYIKNNNSEHVYYINLCLQMIPKMLELLPTYPFIMRFTHWMDESGIYNEQLCSCMIQYMKEKWTEDVCPDRVDERGIVLLGVVSKAKHLTSYDEVKTISPKLCAQNKWWVQQLCYEYDPKKALEMLPEMPIENFPQNIFNHISRYLNDFSKKELIQYVRRVSLSNEEEEKVIRWINIFARNRKKKE